MSSPCQFKKETASICQHLHTLKNMSFAALNDTHVMMVSSMDHSVEIMTNK